MWIKEYKVTVTTDADGDATAYTDDAVRGRILQIRYVKTDFADGSTMTVTLETTGTAVWSEAAVNASATRLPRQATHSTAGVAATYDGTRPVLEPIYATSERVKIVVASGGVTKTGTYYILVG